MSRPAAPPSSRRRFVTVVAVAAALSGSGCAWQPYVATRTVREITGAKLRFHVIVPLDTSLARYRVIEVGPLQDLLGARLPADMERYLDAGIFGALGRLPSSPKVVAAAAGGVGGVVDQPPPTEPTLVVDGFVDDYDPGSRALRAVELGFNHIAVTVRVRLRDRQTGRLLGAASVTAEDDRASGTTRAAIDHLTNRIREFVAKGYAT